MTANSFFPSISRFLTSSSTHLLLVPSGSLASRTWMITSLLSMTFRSSRMNAFEEESRVRAESIGLWNVMPEDGPASAGSCIAATAANDVAVGLAAPSIGCRVSGRPKLKAIAELTFDLPYGIACLPAILAVPNFGTPKSFFSVDISFLSVSRRRRGQATHSARRAENRLCSSRPSPVIVYLYRQLRPLYSGCYDQSPDTHLLSAFLGDVAAMMQGGQLNRWSLPSKIFGDDGVEGFYSLTEIRHSLRKIRDDTLHTIF